MSMTGEQSTSSGGSSRHASPLLRGKACGNCRRRKIKCDAQTPTCASCARYNRPGDPACSYYTPSVSTALSSNEGSSGGPSRTGGRNRVRDLEEEVLRLQKRVKELEEPEDSESVKLFDPYPNRAENSEQDKSDLSLYLYGPRFRTQGGYYAMSPRIQTLVRLFLQHAHEISYFFLNTDQVLTEIISSQCQSSLFHSICLWGSIFSQEEDNDGYGPTDLAAEQTVQLERALATVYHMDSSTSSSTDGSPMRYRMQALVLLCLYQLHQGNLIEARTLLTSAQSLIQSAGYHQLPTSQPGGDAEYMEKVSAFWSVYSLCNIWSVVLGNIPLNSGFDTSTDSDYDEHTRISTGWPVESIPQDPLYDGTSNSTTQPESTISNYLSLPPDPTRTMNEQEMLAKSSILFERTNLTQRSPTSPMVHILNTHLDLLLTPVPSTFLFIQLLTHTSTIQLASLSEKHLFSAKSAAHLLISAFPPATGFIDPAIGYLALVITRVLVDHIVRLNSAQPADPAASAELVGILGSLLEALDRHWSVQSNVITYYTSQIRDMYITLLH